MTDKRLRVFFLDVGQGDCSFIVPPGDGQYAIIVDCHDEYVADRFVADYGIRRLSAVVSHLDIDHIRGMLPFLRKFRENGRRLEEIYLSKDRDRRQLRHRKGALELLDQAKQWEEGRDPVPRQIPFRDGRPRVIWADAGCEVKIVLPYWGKVSDMVATGREEPNQFSVALRLEYAGRSLLIGGDAPLSSWQDLLRDPVGMRADVFRLPHHGGNINDGAPVADPERGAPAPEQDGFVPAPEQDGGTPAAGQDGFTGRRLYEQVLPTIAVVSVGTGNRYRHPLESHLSELRQGAPNTRLLCTQLTDRCHANPLEVRDLALRNAHAAFFPYRHRVLRFDPRDQRRGHEVPCAGTIQVTVVENGSLDVLPAPGGWHENFVDMLPLSPTGHVRALCARLDRRT